MSILSNLFISQVVVAFGAAMLATCIYQRVIVGHYSKTCLVVAIWLLLEVLSDFISTSFSFSVNAVEAVRYYFIFSVASLSMMVTTHLNGSYPRSIRIMFTAITYIGVSMAFYRWGVQSRWEVWGESFYSSYGLLIDSLFVWSIAGLDALMIILGVYSAVSIGFNNNADGGLRG